MLFQLRKSGSLGSIVAAFICLSAFGFMLGGCSGKKVNEDDPASVYQDAEDEVAGGHYQVALEKLKNVKNKFPYSKFALEAQIRIGDVHFLQDNYLEAAAAYEAFRDLHPKHEKIPYVMVRIGLSYFNDSPGTIQRDLTSAQKAVDAFNEYLKRFPSDALKEEALKNRSDARKMLADKELEIANFYFKRDYFKSALGRYAKIMNLYPDTDAAKVAEKRLGFISENKKENPTE